MSNSQEIPYHHQLKIVFVATSLSSLMWKQRDLMQKDALLELAAITLKWMRMAIYNLTKMPFSY